jgi:hypothetical protein
MAVAVDQEGFSQIWTELPAPYAMEMPDEVPVVSVDTATPLQLTASAADSEDLTSSISQLGPCS